MFNYAVNGQKHLFVRLHATAFISSNCSGRTWSFPITSVSSALCCVSTNDLAALLTLQWNTPGFPSPIPIRQAAWLVLRVHRGLNLCPASQSDSDAGGPKPLQKQHRPDSWRKSRNADNVHTEDLMPVWASCLCAFTCSDQNRHILWLTAVKGQRLELPAAPLCLPCKGIYNKSQSHFWLIFYLIQWELGCFPFWVLLVD